MARLNFKLISRTCVMVLAMVGMFSSTGALALDVTCDDSTCTGSETGGLWNDHGFGDCFYMLPTATRRNEEIAIGPSAGETDTDQACIGGDLTLVPNISARVSRDSNPELNAYSWTYDGTGGFTFNAGAAQFIPDDCSVVGLDSTNPDRRNGTFDNGDENIARPILEPLSAELTLSGDVTGDATLSYYFMNGNQECRELDWILKVDGATVKSGTIHDVEDGKYLVFYLTGIAGTETIRLDVSNDDVTPACADAPIEGVNSIISGVFMSGTSVCAPDPFCGDGEVNAPGETCEEPGDAVNPEPVTGPQTCSRDCTYCGDGFTDRRYEECDPTNPDDPNKDMCSDSCDIVQEVPSRTIGYWKRHPTVIDGTFGGAPSLLPLEFCGRDIDDACDAVYFLSKGGGGKKKFMRQGMGALLNCVEFGCPQSIRDYIEDGSEACGNKADFKYGMVGGILADFNEANKDQPLPFKSPSAQPKYCD